MINNKIQFTIDPLGATPVKKENDGFFDYFGQATRGHRCQQTGMWLLS